MSEVIYVDPNTLKRCELNQTLYGEMPNGDLVADVRMRREILQPLMLAADRVTIISGHQRWQAAVVVQLPLVPAIVSELSDELDIREALIASNKQRVKTNEQIALEFRELERIERERASQRQVETRFDDELPSLPKSENPNVSMVVPNLAPPVTAGKARDIAAEKLGVKKTTAVKAKQVVDKIDELKAEGKAEEAEELRQDLNVAVDRAHKKIKGGPKEKPPETARDHLQECLRLSKETSKAIERAIKAHGGPSVHSGAALKALGGFNKSIEQWKADL